MKSPLAKLTASDRELLAHFVGSETHRALDKLIALECHMLAEDHVYKMDIGQIRFLSGKVDALQALLKTLRQNKKDTKTDDEG